jgi:hypothetical protein
LNFKEEWYDGMDWIHAAQYGGISGGPFEHCYEPLVKDCLDQMSDFYFLKKDFASSGYSDVLIIIRFVGHYLYWTV